MREVVWEDRRGWKHRSVVRDDDPDDAAPQGLPLDPPDVAAVDWGAVQRELNNYMVERGIRTWKDMQKHGNVFSFASRVLKRHIVQWLKYQEE